MTPAEPMPSTPPAALTPATIRSLLAAHGREPSRALGQHFLADPNTARRIATAAGVGPGDRVLEIGPGVGSLTVALLAAGARVTALELDRHLVPVLSEATGDPPELRVEVGDALTADLGALLGDGPWTVVANLPYNVAAAIVVRLLEEAPQVVRATVMVQLEVGERLAAPPGSRGCGAISVKASYHAAVRLAGRVPPTVFLPPPAVESVLVRLDRHARPPVEVPSPEAMFGLVRSGFSTRRKMLRRALRPALGDRTEGVLAAAGIDPAARAETLDLGAWARLARAAA